jgi:hypothetical protein
MNEWTDEDQDFEMVYGDRYWASEAGALVKLNQLADEFGAVIDNDATFDARSYTGLERDVYYIRELTRG